MVPRQNLEKPKTQEQILKETPALQGVMAVLSWGRSYCSNIVGVVRGNDFIVKDLNKTEDQVVARMPGLAPSAYTSYLEQVKDSLVANKIVSYLKDAGKLTEKEPKAAASE